MDHPPFLFPPVSLPACAHLALTVLPVSFMCHSGHIIPVLMVKLPTLYGEIARWPSGQLPKRLACIAVRRRGCEPTPLRSFHHCKSDVSRQPHARARSETVAAQNGTTPLLLQSFPPLSPSEYSRGKRKKTIRRSRIYFLMGKDWLFFFFTFCILTPGCQPPSLLRRSFDFTLNRWFIFLHQTISGRMMMLKAATDAADRPLLVCLSIANVSTYRFPTELPLNMVINSGIENAYGQTPRCKKLLAY